MSEIITYETVPIPDNVNHPTHYNKGKYEVIDIINDWNLNFNLGNAIKYIARCDYKSNAIEDLKKAMFYLEYEIKRRENNGDIRQM